MQTPDYGSILHKLLFHACVYEQLHSKFPELINNIGEIFHKEYEGKEVAEFVKEIKKETNQTLSELEGIFLLTTIPKVDPKYTEVLKDVLQLAHTSSPTAHRMPAAKPVRIYLEGCWDLMHSGHYNAIRQVLF